MKLLKLLKHLFILLIFICLKNNSLLAQQKIIAGDLLFQNLNCGELCNAIEAVTQGVDGKNFSHCAIVVKIKDSLKVVEAIGSNVQLTSLQHFFARSGDTNQIKNITVARVSNKYQFLLKKATDFALSQVGKAYDDEFVMNDDKFYCSELVYEAFKAANKQKDFFSLEPMTFKDPKTKSYFPAWIDYYKSLDKSIPEGKPGINPGLISRSKKIDIIKIDKMQQN
jgi:hypothetical protein